MMFCFMQKNDKDVIQPYQLLLMQQDSDLLHLIKNRKQFLRSQVHEPLGFSVISFADD